jgi:hypothetical protein
LILLGAGVTGYVASLDKHQEGGRRLSNWLRIGAWGTVLLVTGLGIFEASQGEGPTAMELISAGLLGGVGYEIGRMAA